MKVILGGTGSGKSTNVARIAAEYAGVSRNVDIISNEVKPQGYLDLVPEPVNTTLIKFHYLPYTPLMSDIVEIIMCKTTNVVLLDLYVPFRAQDLEFLYQIERYTGKELFVTVQTNKDYRDHMLAVEGGNKACVVDWNHLALTFDIVNDRGIM